MGRGLRGSRLPGCLHPADHLLQPRERDAGHLRDDFSDDVLDQALRAHEREPVDEAAEAEPDRLDKDPGQPEQAEGHGGHRQRDVSIPGLVAADLVVVESCFILRGLEALFDGPAGSGDSGQFERLTGQTDDCTDTTELEARMDELLKLVASGDAHEKDAARNDLLTLLEPRRLDPDVLGSVKQHLVCMASGTGSRERGERWTASKAAPPTTRTCHRTARLLQG